MTPNTAALNEAITLVSARGTPAHLRGVMFEGRLGRATNGETFIEFCATSECVKKTWVPVDVLQQALRVKTTDGNLRFGGGHVNGVANPSASNDEFGWVPLPAKVAIKTFTINDERLAACIRGAAEFDVRYYLNGVLFDFHNRAMVAIDGHRLHVYNGDTLPKIENKRCIVPLECANFAYALDAVKCSVRGDGHDLFIAFKGDEVNVWARQVVANFPDWQRVVPSSDAERDIHAINAGEFQAAIAALVDANKAARALITDKKERKNYVPFVDVSRDGLTLRGVMSIPVPLKLVKLHDEPVVGRYDLAYLNDVAQCLDGDATLSIPLDAGAALVTCGAFSAVVMGCRI